jgi:hypothetical protein
MDEMKIDVQEIGLARSTPYNMAIPDLLRERALHDIARSLGASEHLRRQGPECRVPRTFGYEQGLGDTDESAAHPCCAS